MSSPSSTLAATACLYDWSDQPARRAQPAAASLDQAVRSVGCTAGGMRYTAALLAMGDAVSSEGFDLTDWEDVRAKCNLLSSAPLSSGGAWSAAATDAASRRRSGAEMVDVGVGVKPERYVIALLDSNETDSAAPIESSDSQRRELDGNAAADASGHGDSSHVSGRQLAGYAKLKLLCQGSISASESAAVARSLQAIEGPPLPGPSATALGYLGCVVSRSDWQGSGVGFVLSLLATHLAASLGCRFVLCYAMHPAMRIICDRLGYIDPTSPSANTELVRVGRMGNRSSKTDVVQSLSAALEEYWRPLQSVWANVNALRGTMVNRAIDLAADKSRWTRLFYATPDGSGSRLLPPPPDALALLVLHAETATRLPRTKIPLSRISVGDRAEVFCIGGTGQRGDWKPATVKAIMGSNDSCLVEFDSLLANHGPTIVKSVRLRLVVQSKQA
eukprot:SAG31_NODE_3718_length_3951_cov_2.903686_2_plen_446_part_00